MTPIVIAALNAAVELAIQQTVKKNIKPNGAAIAKVATAIIEQQIIEQPDLKNSLNLEKPHQSRVVVGGTTAAISILISAVLTLSTGFGFDIGVTAEQAIEVISAIGVVWGVTYTLYGRLKSGLKPLFEKKV